MPPKKKVPKRIPTMEHSPSENTQRATKALRPLQPVDPVDPDELEDPLALPDEIPRDSDSDASSMGPPGTAAPTKQDHGICPVTKEFLLNKCLEEKAIWENLCNDHLRGGYKYRNYSVVNVLTPYSPGNQGSETIQRNMELHTFPSIEDAIEWVYKRRRVSVQRNRVAQDVGAYILDDCISGSNKSVGACAVQGEGISGITDGIGAYVVQTCGAGIADMQVQGAAARFIFDSREVDGYIQKAGGSGMQDENNLGNDKCLTNKEKLRVPGEQDGIPHVQVLVTGSLNLVGGAIQILHERNG